MSPQRRQKLTDLLIYAAVLLLALLSVRFLAGPLLPLLLGAGFAALLRPAALGLKKRTRMGDKAAAVTVMLAFYILAAVLLGLFAALLLAQLYELLLQLPSLYATTVSPLLDRFSGWFYALAGRFSPQAQGESFSQAVGAAVQRAAVDGSARLVGWAGAFMAKLPMFLLAVLFTVMISIFTAASYTQAGRFVREVIPKDWLPKILDAQRFLRETVWQYVRAYTILMAVTFGELAAGLWLLRFDYVLPVALGITLCDLLPLIGSGTILVPWAAVLLAAGDLWGGVGLLLLWGVMSLVRNILEPRVVSRQTGLHPVATMAAMYFGLRLAGILGLLAAPVLLLFIVKFFFLPAHRES